jgi:uncharacterized OsmC-like protein
MSGSGGTSGPTGVTARLTGAGRFQTAISVCGSEILSDEPLAVGGLASGPTPYELLSAGLASCTAMTLSLYAGGKGWDVSSVRVEVAHSKQDGADRFTRQISFGPEISGEQRTRLLEITLRCPVHRTLESRSEIVTVEVAALDPAAGAEPAEQHLADMEAACGEIEGQDQS